jgi:hypothetical protein
VSAEDSSTFFEVVLDAVTDLGDRGTPFHVLLTGDVPKFEVETAVGVRQVCDHARIDEYSRSV